MAANTNNGVRALFKTFSLEIDLLGRRPAEVCFVEVAPKVTAQPFFGVMTARDRDGLSAEVIATGVTFQHMYCELISGTKS